MSMITTDESADYAPSAVKVYVRVRPFIDREVSLGETDPIVVPYDETSQNIKILDPSTGFKPRDVCSFDDCWFSLREHKSFPFVSQDDIYERTGVVACENVFAGYNSCIFAYGQTGSGKTYTMMGNIMDPSERGIIPRVCESLLDGCAKSKGSLSLQCTYYEIYNERVMDLLDGSSRDELRARNDPLLGPYVEGLSTHTIRYEKDVMRLLSIGNKERHTALTKMNKQSSRSHAVLTLQLVKRDSRHKVYSKINLVDLAGSERTSVSEVEGLHFKEATKINLSLTTLGRVIDALADQASGNATIMPPYRDSLLTWLLSDSLGGNSKTCMIATVSPAAVNFDETLNTLRYASRAREIINICVTNDDPYEKRIKELTMLVEHLRKQLAAQNARSSQGRGSTGSNAEPIDEKSAKHYQEVISRLHQQVNKLAEDNALLEKKLQEEREAHERTMQAGQAESAVLQREIKTIRALSTADVDALKKGNKCLDFAPLSAGRRSFEQSTESSSGRFSARPRTSVSRYELPTRQSRDRPAVDSIEHMDRLVERYTRDMGKIQKEYSTKGQEIIEMQSIRVAKIVQSRPPPRPVVPKTQRSPTNTKKAMALSSQQNITIQPGVSRELLDALAKIESLEEEHVKTYKALQVNHSEAVDTARQELDLHKESHEKALVVLKDQYQNEIAALRSTLEAEKNDISRTYTDRIAALEKEHLEAIALSHNENIAKVETLMESHSAAIDSLQSKHVRSETATSRKHMEEITAIRCEMSESLKHHIQEGSTERERVNFEWKAKYEDLEKDLSGQIESLATEHASEIANVSQAHDVAIKQYENLQTELAHKRGSLEKEIEVEKDKRGALANELDALKKKYASDMDRTLIEHKTVLEDLKKAHADEVKRLETKISKLADSLRDIVQRGVETEKKKQSSSEKHLAEIAALKAESSMLREKELDACRLEFGIEKKSLIKSHEERLCALQETFTAEKESLKEAHAEHDASIEKIHAEAFERIKAEHTAATQEAEQEHSNVVKTLAAQTESMKEEHADDVAKLTNMHQRSIAELKSEHAEHVATIERAHGDAIERIKAEHIVVAKEVEQEHSDLVKTFAAQTEIMKEEHVINVAKLSDMHEQSIAELKNMHAEHITNIEKGHAEAFERIKAEHAAAMQEVNKKHSAAIASAQEASQQTIDKMKIGAETDQSKLQTELEQTVVNMREEADAALATLRTSAQNEKARLEADFRKRIESMDLASKNAVQQCLSASEIEITTLTKKNAEIVDSFANLHQEKVEELKQCVSETAALRKEVRNSKETIQTATLVSLLCTNEASARISLVNVESVKFYELIHKQLMKQSNMRVHEIEQNASKELQSEQKRLGDITAQTNDTLQATKTRHENDFSVLSKTLQKFDAFQRESQRVIGEWQSQHHRIVSDQYAHMHAEQLAALNAAHSASITQIEAENAHEHQVTTTNNTNRLKQLEADFAAIRELEEAERRNRETLIREEAQALQHIYALGLHAFHQRERGLQEIIDVLETASEVAADSSKKQQTQIRKLESSIALYKILQLEGELGMQSGII